jgi:transcription factor TFIIIB component B''
MPSDFGCLEEADKKVTRVRRAPSSCMQRMAKARQEFQNKFGNRAPDRSRLTMFDLIFYNPTTNPMK